MSIPKKIKQGINNNNYQQGNFFDYEGDVEQNNAIITNKLDESISIKFDEFNFENYTVELYKSDVNKYGLEIVWDAILSFSFKNNSKSQILSIDNFGMLYEIGLAEQDKISKKECGQYFTPDDVSILMAGWLKKLKGENVCDVGCGTGNLIISYLSLIGKDEALRLLVEKKIYLYDYDKIALKIAKYTIAIIYGVEYLEHINTIQGDFLDKKIKLPPNSKVITNPPYAKISNIKNSWDKTENLITSKDLYSAFIEKILVSNSQAVIISPYSFLGGSKFYPLRKVLNNYNGFIVAFDNVPGNIFKGKKHGVFNTNTANSVRAAITVVENNFAEKGFRVSHLIRFKTEEREKLLSNDYLETLLGKKRQLVTIDNTAYVKCHKELENAFNIWVNSSNKRIYDLLSKTENEFAIYIPNTCRYFTTAATYKLSRTGIITLYAKNEDCYNLLYCIINSSFAYWWWRIFDGGITYPVGLLYKLPVFDNLLSEEDKLFLLNTRVEMASLERKFISTKLNAGSKQENIKFPKRYREQINSRFFKILNCTDNPFSLNLVHSNRVFGLKNEDE